MIDSAHIESVSRRNALIALALMSLIWSYNWIVMKTVLRYIGPFDFSVLRSLLGTLMLFLVLRLRGESLAPPPWRDVVWIGLAQTTGFQALSQLALVYGGAGKTALLAYTMPFWVVPLAWILLGERPGLRRWAWIALAGSGLVLIMQPWRADANPQSAVLALTGGLLWALATVLSKRLFQKARVSPLQLTAWQMLVGTFGIVAIALCVHERDIVWGAPLLAALIYNGVLASALAWALWLFVVKRLPAGVAGLSSLITPLLGVLLAWWVLDERPDRFELVGIALIAIALGGVLRPRPA
jgi:drug/metabolite transporter (DMT)-like permease